MHDNNQIVKSTNTKFFGLSTIYCHRKNMLAGLRLKYVLHVMQSGLLNILCHKKQ
jgi:hypothetical protein